MDTMWPGDVRPLWQRALETRARESVIDASALDEQIRWLLRDPRTGGAGVLPKGVVGFVLGEGGIGKGKVLAQIAVSVASGSRLFGEIDVVAPGRVLLALGEDDHDEAHRHLYRATRQFAPSATMPPDGSIVVLPLRGQICALLDRDEAGNARETLFLEWLRSRVEKLGPFALVVLDPSSRFGGPDFETDNAAGTRYVQTLEGIASLGPAVLVTHHVNKLARGPGGVVEPYSSRGSTSVVDGGRWAAVLSRERIDHGDKEVNERLSEIVTVRLGRKSNVSREAPPIELRRDWSNGGVLVPIDETDRELVALARSGEAKRANRAAERENERDHAREERERKDAERKAAAASQKEATTRRCNDEDDDAARKLIAEHPDAKVGELTALLRKALACGQNRAHAAISRVRRTS